MRRLLNDEWEFARLAPGASPEGARWQPVDIPHDFLIEDANDLYADAEPYMVTNLSVGRVSSIAVEGADYANGGILAPEGEYTEHEYATGAIHVEFRPDETSLREAVLALFYKPVSP